MIMSDCKKIKREQLNDEELMNVDGGKLLKTDGLLYQNNWYVKLTYINEQQAIQSVALS